MKIVSHFIDVLRDILSPARCYYCLQMLERRVPLCEACRVLLRRVVSVELPLSVTDSMTVHAVGAYEGPLQKLIRAKGYRNSAAAHQAGKIFAEHVRDMIGNHNVLVPIPLHWLRYSWRGYNQAAVLADEINRVTNASVCHALSRVRSTAFQARKNREERWHNVAYSLIPSRRYAEQIIGKHVIIIDDLMTTGSTLKVAAKALKKMRPASIKAFVLARVV